MRRHQAADGAWHQVVDEPGTYREFTVTAMTVAAMARGLRLGWLDRSFDEVVDSGLAGGAGARLGDRRVGGRLHRHGRRTERHPRVLSAIGRRISGPDDRGGAMALAAALEMHALTSGK